MKKLFLFRLWQKQSLYSLCWAILLAILTMTAITLLSSRLQNTLTDKTGALLGGDKLLSSAMPIDPSIAIQARNDALEVSAVLQFTSMLVHKQDLALIEVKAIDENYPLRGKIQNIDPQTLVESDLNGIPELGSVWLEKRAAEMLHVSLNDTIQIGQKSFVVKHIIRDVIARGTESIWLAPRALMNPADIIATGLIQVGSRQSYQLFFAGTKDQLSKFSGWLTPRLSPELQYVDLQTGQGAFKKVVDNTHYFLEIVLYMTVFLAAALMMFAIRNFVNQHISTIALLTALGAKHRDILIQIFMLIFLLGFIVCLLGAALGYGLQILLVHYLKDIFNLSASNIVSFPLVMSILGFLLLLMGFTLPALSRLQQIPPIWVFQGRGKEIAKITITDLLFGLSVIALMLFLHTNNIQTTASTLIWVLALIAVTSQAVQILSHMLRPFLSVFNFSLRFGLENVIYHIKENALQMAAIALSVAAIWSLYLLQHDLLKNWQNQIPQNAPNYFVINLPSIEVSHFEEYLQKHDIASSKVYPLVRGRLVSINGKDVSQNIDVATNKAPARLLNFTQSADLPDENDIVAGKWFPPNDKDVLDTISIEEGFADRVDAHLGDTLVFQIAENSLSAKVSSIRAVDWNSFRPNFYVIFPPGVLDNFPMTYMTSFYLAANKTSILNDLVKFFPSISIIDIANILTQIRTILEAGSYAIYAFSLIVFALGILILYVIVNATLKERQQNQKLLRILGASRKQILFLTLSEFGLMALMTAVVAAIFANGLIYGLSKGIFHIPYYFNGTVTLLGLISTVIVILFFGFIGREGVKS